MKKTRKILLWVVGVPALLYAVLYAVRFQTTLPIEGVLVDAKTGKPVSKALVHANWFFSYPNLVDTTSGGFGHGTVTDEEGRFRIPRKDATAALGRFIDQTLMVKHPLYEFLNVTAYSPWLDGKEFRLGTIEGGVMKVRLPIMSLEDKYSKPEDMSALSRAIDDCGPDFYVAMRDNFGTRYDLDDIMKNLERLATRFQGRDYQKNFVYRTYVYHEMKIREFMKSY